MSFPCDIKISDLCLFLLDEEMNLACKVGGLYPFDTNAKRVSHSVDSVSGKNIT